MLPRPSICWMLWLAASQDCGFSGVTQGNPTRDVGHAHFVPSVFYLSIPRTPVHHARVPTHGIPALRSDWEEGTRAPEPPHPLVPLDSPHLFF